MNLRGLLSELWHAALDAVLPPRERTQRTRALTLESIELAVASHELLRMRITTLLDYRRDEVRDLVQALKYDGSTHAARLCAGALEAYLREELVDAKTFGERQILLVPVPLHRSRERERGFNQIALALTHLPSELLDGTLATFAPTLLSRTRATKPQTHFARSERLSNLAGAFAVENSDIKKALIFLIDDVATTGATLVNASTPLRRAGADVRLIALARA